MAFERRFEPLTVRVDGDQVVIEPPEGGGWESLIYVPVAQVPLFISWIQEAQAEIEADRARGEG